MGVSTKAAAAAVCFLFALEMTKLSAFSTSSASLQTRSDQVQYTVFQPSTDLKSSSVDEDETITTPSNTEDLYFPISFDEMVRQASSTMEDAYAQGKTRQIIRLLLPRSAENDNLGQYFEEDAEDQLGETVLVPPDETWQGGISKFTYFWREEGNVLNYRYKWYLTFVKILQCNCIEHLHFLVRKCSGKFK
jgi:hypothetical protein